jgi:transcriptional regulator GlxA family with amidase domain
MSSRLDGVQDWEELAAAAKYRASQLARRCQISDRQLRRFFLEKFGVTPQDWISQLRLRKAPLLISTGQSIKVTAFELGFKQPSHFCREFKRVYGSSPRTYILVRSSSKGLQAAG